MSTTTPNLGDANEIIAIAKALGVEKRDGRVLALTIHRNHTGDFASALVSADGTTLLDGYPVPNATSVYKEKRVGDLFVVYNDNLAPLDELDVLKEATAPDVPPENAHYAPFCCAQVNPCITRRLDKDAAFQQFFSGTGTSPYMVEVKKQIDRGRMLSETLYELRDGVRIESNVPERSISKVHSFKNYKCVAHNLYYAVDLYKKGAAYNEYHMRLIPFTKNTAKFASLVRFSKKFIKFVHKLFSFV